MKIYDFIILYTLCVTVLSENIHSSERYLEPGDPFKFSPDRRRLGFLVRNIEIYCYRGSEKSLGSIFQTVHLHLDIENDDYTQYEGSTAEIVREHYEEQRSIFSLNILSTKRRRLKLNPFNQSCIGIETLQPYQVNIDLIRIDFWKVIYVAIGILAFWFSAKLSENALFYYLSGVLLGIFASFLILVYLASKLFPRRPVMYGVLLGGWTIAIYFIQILWDNLQLVFMAYKAYVFWYIVITGFTSFVICYRLGPPKNKRSKNLIKWGLQLAALLLIFFSSDFQEAASALDILVVLFYYFPHSWINKCRSFYIRRFPPKPRLLSNEEYYEQGYRETTKALDELRKYCSSPDCKQWHVVTKLHNPRRFAEFIEGSSHLIDEEILEYETSRGNISDSDASEDENNPAEITEDEEEQNGGQASCKYNQSIPKKATSLTRNGIQSEIGWRNDIIYASGSADNRRSYLYRSYERDYTDSN